MNVIDKLQKVYGIVINEILLLGNLIPSGRACRARDFSDYVFSGRNVPSTPIKRQKLEAQSKAEALHDSLADNAHLEKLIEIIEALYRFDFIAADSLVDALIDSL